MRTYTGRERVNESTGESLKSYAYTHMHSSFKVIGQNNINSDIDTNR